MTHVALRRICLGFEARRPLGKVPGDLLFELAFNLNHMGREGGIGPVMDLDRYGGTRLRPVIAFCSRTKQHPCPYTTFDLSRRGRGIFFYQLWRLIDPPSFADVWLSYAVCLDIS